MGLGVAVFQGDSERLHGRDDVRPWAALPGVAAAALPAGQRRARWASKFSFSWRFSSDSLSCLAKSYKGHNSIRSKIAASFFVAFISSPTCYEVGAKHKKIDNVCSDAPNGVRRVPAGQFQRVPVPVPEVPQLQPVPGLLLAGKSLRPAHQRARSQGVHLLCEFF